MLQLLLESTCNVHLFAYMTLVQSKLVNLFCLIPEWRMRRNMRYGYGSALARRAEAHRRRSARNDASPFCRSEGPEITLKGPPSLVFSRPTGQIISKHP